LSANQVQHLCCHRPHKIKLVDSRRVKRLKVLKLINIILSNLAAQKLVDDLGVEPKCLISLLITSTSLFNFKFLFRYIINKTFQIYLILVCAQNYQNGVFCPM